MIFPLLLAISRRLAALVPTALMSLAAIGAMLLFAKKAFILSAAALAVSMYDHHRARRKNHKMQYEHVSIPHHHLHEAHIEWRPEPASHEAHVIDFPKPTSYYQPTSYDVPIHPPNLPEGFYRRRASHKPVRTVNKIRDMNTRSSVNSVSSLNSVSSVNAVSAINDYSSSSGEYHTLNANTGEVAATPPEQPAGAHDYLEVHPNHQRTPNSPFFEETTAGPHDPFSPYFRSPSPRLQHQDGFRPAHRPSSRTGRSSDKSVPTPA